MITSCYSEQKTTNVGWWKGAVVYQIYPRSFKDSDGDGIGDLKGIISELDYIKSLGIDVVWLNPVFSSPNVDNGYDISDYRGIMKEYGTMEDFDALLKGLHERGLKLVLDLVVNHSSDEHEWFKQSRSSRTNPYRDYYIWWPAEKGEPSPRVSFFDENANAWAYDSITNAYYLHYFSKKQPDLNWQNPKVRQEVYSLMTFWLDKGINGYRMDVIPYISKDTLFPVVDRVKYPDITAYYAEGPHLHEYLQEMNREVLNKYDIMTVGEGAGVLTKDAAKFVAPDRKELNMIYYFDYFENDKIRFIPSKDPNLGIDYSLPELKKMYERWDKAVGDGWPTIYMGNHDQPRMISCFGSDSPEFREISGKMLYTFLLTMRATPYLYYGNEIGMTNIRFDRIEDYNDILTINRYHLIEKEGGDTRAYIEEQKLMGRDNARTPMQWDSTMNAGFTSGKPWLKINPNYNTVNVTAQDKEPNSLLNYFRKLIQFRKANKGLICGSFRLLDENNTQTFSYIRESKRQKFLVVLNFSKKGAQAQTGIYANNAKIVLNNYGDQKSGKIKNTIFLKPFEAIVYQLR